jgi:hypothetical protein
MAAVLLEAFVLEEGALQRHRPAFADKPHIGQGLLDADAACRPPDQEDEVQVSVADLADLPITRLPAQPGGDVRLARKEGGDAGDVERRIACRSLKRHDDLFLRALLLDCRKQASA